jgi:hypothetical protein
MWLVWAIKKAGEIDRDVEAPPALDRPSSQLHFRAQTEAGGWPGEENKTRSRMPRKGGRPSTVPLSLHSHPTLGFSADPSIPLWAQV